MGIGWLIHDLLTTKKHNSSGALIFLPVAQPNAVDLAKASSSSTTDEQGKFLHKLSQKVFNFLQSKSKVDEKSNVIAGLKYKFSGWLENEEDKGENFKSLCEAQLQKEPNGDNLDGKYSVNVEESRLCFMGVNENKEEVIADAKKTENGNKSKQNFFGASYSSYYGNLSKWDSEEMQEEESDRPYPHLGFNKYKHTNLDLGNQFKSKYSEDKFDEGFNTLDGLKINES